MTVTFTFNSKKGVNIIGKITKTTVLFKEVDTKNVLYKLENPDLPWHLRLVDVIEKCKELFNQHESENLTIEHEYEYCVSVPVTIEFNFITKASNEKAAKRLLEKKIKECGLNIKSFPGETFIEMGDIENIEVICDGEIV